MTMIATVSVPTSRKAVNRHKEPDDAAEELFVESLLGGGLDVSAADRFLDFLFDRAEAVGVAWCRGDQGDVIHLSPAAGAALSASIPLLQSKLRMICARLAIRCSTWSTREVSPYRDQVVVTSPKSLQAFDVVFENSPAVQRIQIRRTSRTSTGKMYALIKRIADVLLGAVLFLVSVPLLALAAIAIKLTSHGPIFFEMIRLGERGRRFRFYKLRTMGVVAETPSNLTWTQTQDVRITPLGRILRRTHVDELPQFWNVIRGDMSLVGPRPVRPEISIALEREIPHYSDRLLVAPGITGLSQVLLPPDTDLGSARTKARLDAYYVRHAGPWLDARILIATLLVV